jgi:hypothetical protein
MPRPKASGASVRFNLEVTEATKDRVLRLMKETEAASMTEVIVRALRLYELLLNKSGDEQVVLLKGGKKTSLLMF